MRTGAPSPRGNSGNFAEMNPAKVPATFLSAANGLRGEVRVPGDKSLSHRALLLGAVATGVVRVSGFLRAADTLSTLAAIRSLGVEVEDGGGEELVVRGGGWEGLSEPEDVIDVGNAGTLMRLLPGILAGVDRFAVLTGDDSIRRRPMSRIVRPLTAMGAFISGREGGRYAPLALRGGNLRGLEHRMEVSSAQVKSCLLLAGLRAEGTTTVIDPGASRDHTERLLQFAGIPLTRGSGDAPGETWVQLEPVDAFRLPALRIPADPSSAAFLVVAALLVPDSEVTLLEVGLNPTRTGLFDVLLRMGARLEIEGEETPAGQQGPEPVGSLRALTSELSATDVGGEEVPGMIDELPIWALAAGAAQGTSRLRGAAELRVKESDRISGTAELLRALGVEVFEYEDGMDIVGRPERWQGGTVESRADHRLAMAGAVAGLASRGGVTVDDVRPAAVSFPGFTATIESLRAG